MWWSKESVWRKSNSVVSDVQTSKTGFGVFMWAIISQLLLQVWKNVRSKRTKWEIPLIPLGSIPFEDCFWPQRKHKNKKVNNERLREEQKRFPFKGLISSPVRLSYATSIISRHRSLSAPRCTKAASPPYQSSALQHSTRPCEPTLHGKTGTWRVRLNEGGWKSKTFKRTDVDKLRTNDTTDLDRRLKYSRTDRISFVTSSQTTWCDADDDWPHNLLLKSSVSACFVSRFMCTPKLFTHRRWIHTCSNECIWLCLHGLESSCLYDPFKKLFVCLHIFMSQALHTKDSYPCECLHHGNRLLLLLHHCRQVTTNSRELRKQTREHIQANSIEDFLENILQVSPVDSACFIFTAQTFIKLMFEVYLSNFIIS